MPKSKSNRKRQPSKSGKNRTHLLEHKKVGSELQPSFSQLKDKLGGRLVFSQWSDERLPEFLWAAIIRVIDGQDFAISEFKRILNFIIEHPRREKLSDLSISGISSLDDQLRDEFLSFLLSNPVTASALSILKIFKEMPSRDVWLKYLPTSDEANLQILMAAVGMCFPHQSQEATDCRWLKVMIQIASNKLHVPSDMKSEFLGYPYEGDMRKIRPSIRSLEMTCILPDSGTSNWSKNFWNSAWKNTPCIELTKENSENDKSKSIEKEITNIQSLLETHWSETHCTTGVDAKHDGTFGIAFYSLKLINEISSSNTQDGILARLGLRTLLECHINLRHLSKQNDDELWKKWRTYGAGQAKLNALKFDEIVERPNFISQDMLESIAGEDLWEEFINIELGNWSGGDLRKISQSSGLKSIYDQYYSWASTYSHGTWGAIREVCFETCGNPLHRLHRYPKYSSLPNTIKDACIIVNGILDDLSKAYPSFNHKLLIE